MLRYHARVNSSCEADERDIVALLVSEQDRQPRRGLPIIQRLSVAGLSVTHQP